MARGSGRQVLQDDYFADYLEDEEILQEVEFEMQKQAEAAEALKNAKQEDVPAN